MNNIWRLLVGCCAVVGLGAGPSQGPEVSSVMREKLVHAQNILEAVVTSNWISLETESRKLEQLTKDPRWTALDTRGTHGTAEHSFGPCKRFTRRLRNAISRRLRRPTLA